MELVLYFEAKVVREYTVFLLNLVQDCLQFQNESSCMCVIVFT